LMLNTQGSDPLMALGRASSFPGGHFHICKQPDEAGTVSVNSSHDTRIVQRLNHHTRTRVVLLAAVSRPVAYHMTELSLCADAGWHAT
jgi:hypothetical protein